MSLGVRRCPPEQIIRSLAFGFGWMLSVMLTGCALALPPVTPRAKIRLRIVAESPQIYGVRLRVNEAHDYRVALDGRVILDVPAYRPGCSTYLFGIKLRNGFDPYTAKTLDVFEGAKAAHRMSLKQIYALPLDKDGFYILKYPSTK